MMGNMEAQVRSRGRVTIPAEIRRHFGIRSRTKLIVREEEEHIVVMTFAQYVHALRGILKGKGIMEQLMTERRREAQREDEGFNRD